MRRFDLLESGTVIYINSYRLHAVMGGRVFNGKLQFTSFALVYDIPFTTIEQEARVLHAAENVRVVRDA